MQIDVSGHSFVFPDRCACCCGAANASLSISATKTSGKRVVHSKTNVWDVSYCNQCLAHVKAVESARTLAWLFTALSVFVAAIFWSEVGQTAGIGIGLLAMAGTLILFSNRMQQARSMCSPNCACVGRAATYLGWHGSLHKFDFASASFASEFMVINQKKLVNLSPQARTLLSQSGVSDASNVPRSPRRYIT